MGRCVCAGGRYDDSITKGVRITLGFGCPIRQNNWDMKNNTPESAKYVGCPMRQTMQANTAIYTPPCYKIPIVLHVLHYNTTWILWIDQEKSSFTIHNKELLPA
jgi:hypothetical protein